MRAFFDPSSFSAIRKGNFTMQDVLYVNAVQYVAESMTVQTVKVLVWSLSLKATSGQMSLSCS